MRERDIRILLKAQLAEDHSEDTDAVIVEEMAVCWGAARVDLALLNGSIHGFEIKSAADTLERLPQQVVHYGKAFDYLTIVFSGRSSETVLKHVPEWWGLIRAEGGKFLPLRTPRPNPSIDPFSVAQLLWREEALDILEERGLAKGVRSKPKRELWLRMAKQMPLDELKEIVRQRLKNRSDWRADSLLPLSGD